MHSCHASNPSEATPNESEYDTWTSHGSMGPQRQTNHAKTGWTPGTDLRTHRAATRSKHETGGLTRGSVDPTGQSNRPWLGLSCASTWWLSIGPRRHPWGVCLHSSPVHGPINRRRRGSLMRHPHLQHLSHF
jgi:hypothetical protein